MTIELADGVYALELTVERGDGTATFHPAAVTTPRGVVLLDAGLPRTDEQLAAELETAGLSMGDGRLVVLTHQDGDHAGSTAAVLARRARSPPPTSGRPRTSTAESTRSRATMTTATCPWWSTSNSSTASGCGPRPVRCWSSPRPGTPRDTSGRISPTNGCRSRPTR